MELNGQHPLHEEAAVHGIGAGDINQDGLTDIVTPEGWLEQSNSGTDWNWHPEFSLSNRTSIPILIHDVDTDGDIDIVCPGKSGLFRMENLLRQ